MGAFCPHGRHHDLSGNRRNARQNIAEPPRHQADYDIQNAIGCYGCQYLSVNQLWNALQRHPERIVDFSQQEEQHRKQTDHGPVALPTKLCIDLIRIIQLPTKCKRNCDHYQIDDFYDFQHHIMLKFWHNTPITPSIVFFGSHQPSWCCHESSFFHCISTASNKAIYSSCRNQGVSSIWIMEDTSYFSPCTNSRLILSWIYQHFNRNTLYHSKLTEKNTTF